MINILAGFGTGVALAAGVTSGHWSAWVCAVLFFIIFVVDLTRGD